MLRTRHQPQRLLKPVAESQSVKQLQSCCTAPLLCCLAFSRKLAGEAGGRHKLKLRVQYSMGQWLQAFHQTPAGAAAHARLVFPLMQLRQTLLLQLRLAREQPTECVLDQLGESSAALCVSCCKRQLHSFKRCT